VGEALGVAEDDRLPEDLPCIRPLMNINTAATYRWLPGFGGSSQPVTPQDENSQFLGAPCVTAFTNGENVSNSVRYHIGKDTASLLQRFCSSLADE
jgi:hypothetical protein